MNENISHSWVSTPTWAAPRARFRWQLLWAAGLPHLAPGVAPARPAELASPQAHQLRDLALSISLEDVETSSPISSLTRGTATYISLVQGGLWTDVFSAFSPGNCWLLVRAGWVLLMWGAHSGPKIVSGCWLGRKVQMVTMNHDFCCDSFCSQGALLTSSVP